MNLQQAKIILEKINRLYQSMTLDSKIDIHEQELMLSYIRQFYNSFSGDVDDLSPKTKARTTKPIVQAPPNPPTKVVEKREPPVAKTPPPVVETPKPTPPPPSPTPAPKVVVKKETPTVVSSPPPVAKPSPPPSPAKEVSKSSTTSGEYEVLFEHKEAKELSDKLAETPIRDLTKAISINERILTVQELFGGENQAFSDALAKLNGFKNLEEAKPFLTELAKKYKWTDKGRKKKAKVFIKLIRRRYK